MSRCGRAVGRSWTFPWGALAPVGTCARVRAAIKHRSDRTTEGPVLYQEFLIIWKDADPDIPIYKSRRASFMFMF